MPCQYTRTTQEKALSSHPTNLSKSAHLPQSPRHRSLPNNVHQRLALRDPSLLHPLLLPTSLRHVRRQIRRAPPPHHLDANPLKHSLGPDSTLDRPLPREHHNRLGGVGDRSRLLLDAGHAALRPRKSDRLRLADGFRRGSDSTAFADSDPGGCREAGYGGRDLHAEFCAEFGIDAGFGCFGYAG